MAPEETVPEFMPNNEMNLSMGRKFLVKGTG